MLSESDESRVLIIYTGGTIGMLVGQHGFVPEPYFLTETLRSQSRFHDPLEDSFFSHSTSVEGFREWSNSSGRSTPVGDTFTHTAPDENINAQHTLLVRSSRPIGASDSLAPLAAQSTAKQPVYTQVSDGVYEAYLPSLVTPRNVVHGGTSRRIRYAILEWHPLLDSSNIEITDWIRIATEIELNYSFDAFVVLHGTDTMSYTSSALSFLLENLGKTVILTGAQIPLSQLRNDAVDNLLGALSIAGHYIIPECCLYFNHTLFRGNRVSKTSSYDFNAFSSPNFPALVNVGIDIVVNWNDVLRQKSIHRFKAHKTMDSRVATLRLFPGITAATVRAFVGPPIRGVVLETFGSGNAPQRTDLMQSLKEACDRGVVIVAISQCAKGSVSDAYETGRTLLDAGVVPGCDMTPECALAKLSYLLSKPELSIGKVRELISTPLRGELTLPLGSASSPSTMTEGLNNIQNVVFQIARLSSTAFSTNPQIIVSPSLDKVAQKVGAAWSWTATDATSTEAALLPYLIHLAAARDDVEALTFCLTASSSEVTALMDSQTKTVGGGVVNCLEPVSGRSPLHAVSLNGSSQCLRVLLQSGALVHLRDSLGHTALYYAARQGFGDIVDILLEAGGNLSGSDVDGGFAALAVKKAHRLGDDLGLKIWAKAGIRP